MGGKKRGIGKQNKQPVINEIDTKEYLLLATLLTTNNIRRKGQNACRHWIDKYESNCNIMVVHSRQSDKKGTRHGNNVVTYVHWKLWNLQTRSNIWRKYPNICNLRCVERKNQLYLPSDIGWWRRFFSSYWKRVWQTSHIYHHQRCTILTSLTTFGNPLRHSRQPTSDERPLWNANGKTWACLPG